MKFYDIDDIFTFGKYEGETLAEVFEKDPKYIKYCEENIDDFYVSPGVMKSLRTLSRDNRLMTANLDEMTDDELQEFMSDMNDIDDFDESKLEEDFDWEDGENMFADEDDDLFGEEEYLDESEFDEPFDDPFNDNY
ncbi:MAG: hypothetical protein KBT67_00165 [bacterium]|nr:hypothetical protein [Candidatus Limimorpha caballi]MCQ2315811.1 hypothetical protein [Bacteroidales bacterium]